MIRRSKILVVGAAALALGAAGAGVAVATGDDDETQKAISGSALERASAAALEHTGGGEVSETEAGDEESFYEVEVTRPDGSQVDVQLDRGFNVVGGETDGPESSEDDD